MNGRLRLTAMCSVATLLGTAPLAPLFETWAWLGYAILTVATVTGVALAARRLAAPEGLVALINLGALVLLVSALFGNGSEIFGVIPTGGTLGALRQLVSAAGNDVVQLAVPVPARRGLLLLTVLGVGAVAIVIDALAVSLRRSALTGLPLLAMFAVPVAVDRDGIGWLPFAVGATGYLVLLLSEGRDRITRWGRPFTEHSTEGDGWRPDPLEASPIAAVGRRIGAAAIGIAVVVPVVIPFVHAGGLAGLASGQGVGPGPGGGYSAALNPITQLRGQLVRLKPVELLRVRTNDPNPFYLRVTTLDSFSLDGWNQTPLNSAQARPVSAGLPGPGIGRGVPTRKLKTSVQVRGLGSSQYLPVYPTPTQVAVKGDWRYDRRSGAVFSSRTNTRDLRYSFSSVTPDRFSLRLIDQLKQSPEAPDDLQLAYGRDATPEAPKIAGRVSTVVAGKKTPYDKALALYNYFRDGTRGFRYSTSTSPGNSGNALQDFLDKKAGYCEQYASAMAAMARYAGLPARVAIGYTKGQHKKNGYWSVTTSDAHAWVEIFFANVGWVAWDPTPLGAAGRATTLPYAVAAPATGGSAPGTPPAAQDGETNKAHQIGAREDREGRSDTSLPLPPPLKPAAPPDHRGQWMLAGLLVALLVLVPSVTRVAVRHARLRRATFGEPRPAANAAWDEVLATAYDLGYGLDEALTPRLAARRLARDARLDATSAQTLRHLALTEEQARYSPRPPSADGLVPAVRQLRRAMLTAADRRASLRARAFPPSAIRFAGQRSGVGIADVLDRFDALLARIRKATLHRLSPSRS